jgi:hypothetical protein
MKRFVISFLAFSTAMLVVRLVEGHELNAGSFGIALGGGLIAACLFDGLMLLFQRLFHWLGRHYAKRQKEV